MPFLEYNKIRFLDIYMIQRRSNKLYKQAEHDWKRELCNEGVSKRCLGFERGAYTKRCPKEATMQISTLLLLFAPQSFRRACNLSTSGYRLPSYNIFELGYLFVLQYSNSIDARFSDFNVAFVLKCSYATQGHCPGRITDACQLAEHC